MQAMLLERAGAPLRRAEIVVPEPGPGQILIKVAACGVCRTDLHIFDGELANPKLPLVLGHEIVGRIEALGDGVQGFPVGDRIGVPWLGFTDGTCAYCRAGEENLCDDPRFTGYQIDGGYAAYTVADARYVFRLPEGYTDAEAAPLLCAGITTFNALRNSPARAGDTVAILGIGGLGHLGVQFATKMGFRTVAIARGREKEPLARELGAHHYVDTESQDPASALQSLGGARVILATVTSAQAMTRVVGGLGADGQLLVVGASIDPIEVSPLQLIPGRRSIAGWPSGTAIHSEDTLNFSAMTGVRPRIEIFPLERAADAYERMMSGKARFRVVLQVAK